MDHGVCDLSQVGEVALLKGRPRRRNSKQSMDERLVVCKKSKPSTFKHEPEMKERRVDSQELNGAQEPSRSCCRTGPRWVLEGSNAREMGEPGPG